MNTTNDIQATPARKRRSCLGCLGRGVIGLLILLVVAMIVGAIYQSAASASDTKKYSPPGELYDVGEYRLHLYCTGEGSPTVILEAGANSPGLVWYLVQEEVAKFTRVCSYRCNGKSREERELENRKDEPADLKTDLPVS